MSQEKMATKEDKSWNKRGFRKKKIYDNIFYWGLLCIPLFMLIIRYVYINFNSILLAFKEFDDLGNIGFAGFDNFKQVFIDFAQKEAMSNALKNSIQLYLINVIVTTIVPVIFSYYLFKKYPGTGFFKVLLYVPHIVSGLVTVMIFKFIVDRVMPGMEIIEKGLLSNEDTRYGAIMFYYLWSSFGAGMMLQVGAMNATDINTIEAGYIDGVNFWQEFWYIVLPSCYKVLALGFITGIASIFTNQFNLYAFYGPNAPSDVQVMGYYYYIKTLGAGENVYPYWAAWGLIGSLIVIPLTFLGKHLVYKYGPSED